MSSPERPAGTRQLPLDRIRPGSGQARRHFDAEALADLARSLRESGQVQPVVVRPRGEVFELLAGERRWRAAQLAGWTHLEAVIRDDLDEDEAHVLGLVENLQRESLMPIEAAEGLRRLSQRWQLTHEQIGSRIGKSREYVSNHLRLLKLCASVQEAVNRGELELGHAKVLASLPEARQRALAEATRAGRWSVRRLEREAARGRARTAPAPADQDDWQRLQQALADQLGCPVRLLRESAQRGELCLRFHSLEELEGLLQRLGYRESGAGRGVIDSVDG